jgi:hypothetical protein
LLLFRLLRFAEVKGRGAEGGRERELVRLGKNRPRVLSSRGMSDWLMVGKVDWMREVYLFQVDARTRPIGRRTTGIWARERGAEGSMSTRQDLGQAVSKRSSVYRRRLAGNRETVREGRRTVDDKPNKRQRGFPVFAMPRCPVATT